MLDPRRIETNLQPEPIELLGNGTYYYNYDIKSEIVCIPQMNGSTKEEERWNYIQIHLSGTPEYKACARAIIRQYIDEESEFSVINDFNAHQLGIRKDEKAYSEYIEYINLVSEIKSKIKSDFNK